MEKGKLGFSLWIYAALAFASACLGQFGLIAVAVISLFVLFAEEENAWLRNQIMQAAALSVIGLVGSLVLSWVPDLVGNIAYVSVIGLIFGLLHSLWTVALVLLAIIAILHVSKGKDAGIPVISAIFNGKSASFGAAAPDVPQPVAQPVTPLYFVPPQEASTAVAEAPKPESVVAPEPVKPVSAAPQSAYAAPQVYAVPQAVHAAPQPIHTVPTPVTEAAKPEPVTPVSAPESEKPVHAAPQPIHTVPTPVTEAAKPEPVTPVSAPEAPKPVHTAPQTIKAAPEAPKPEPAKSAPTHTDDPLKPDMTPAPGRVCRKCGNPLSATAQFCAQCGTRQTEPAPAAPVAPAAPTVCASCGSPLREGAKFCAVCGSRVV